MTLSSFAAPVAARVFTTAFTSAHRVRATLSAETAANVSSWTKALTYALFILVIALFWADYAGAAVTEVGDAFTTLWETLRGWCESSLGKAISLMFLLVGIFSGVARGNLFAAVCCIGCALCMILAPQVIEAVFDVSGA